MVLDDPDPAFFPDCAVQDKIPPPCHDETKRVGIYPFMEARIPLLRDIWVGVVVWKHVSNV